MTEKLTVGGAEIEIGFDEELNVIASYACPNCQAPNRVNLSEFGEGDKIPCISCGVFAFDLAGPGFRPVRESIANLKRTFEGFKK